MTLVWKNAYMQREDTPYDFDFFIFWAAFYFPLTAGLLSPTADIADIYEPLCNDNDCLITIDKYGLSACQGFIGKEKINQWYTGGDEYNLS